MRAIPLAASLLLLLPGCFVRVHDARPVYVPPPPPSRPPPPPPRMMTYDEAVSRGFSECRARGFECSLKNANLSGKSVWKVRFKVAGRGGKGHLHLELDAYSRALLDADEKVHGHGHGHGREDDDD